MTSPPPSPAAGAALVDLFDAAVGDVYGYFVRRCRNRAEAEDLTSEVFLAAVDAVRRAPPPDLGVAWLIGVARHKLVDHWRRVEREQRRLVAVADQPDEPDDPWDVTLDVLVAREVLARLAATHRSVLTLRYVDGLSVGEVAACIERTVHGTEALLTRAKRAFRAEYQLCPGQEGGDDR